MAIVDYDLPYTAPRLWIIDRLHGNRVVAHVKVSHAEKSGDLYAETFSNRRGSKISSLGSFVTGRPYTGRFGRSLKVHGLDKKLNGNAYRRAIVIHPTLEMTHSWGCFMLPNDRVHELVELLKDGTFLFVHHSSLQET
jgi:hypothetical protein